MKTPRIPITLRALLLLALLSLPITLTASSSSAPTQKRPAVLTVRVTDEGGAPITAAHISVFQGEQHLGQMDTDTRGIAQLEINLTIGGAVELFLEVSKPGMVTKQHKMRLGTSFPPRLPLEEIELKGDVPRADTILSIKVIDDDRREVSGALVEVDQSSVPVGRGNTNTEGVAQIAISVRPNQPLAVRASKQGLQPGSSTINLGANIPQRLPIEEVTLKPAAGGGGGDDKFLLTVKAVDGDGKGIKLAHVNIYLTTWGTDSIVRPPDFQLDTNADGMRDFEIPVKPGQKNFDITIEVSREDMQTKRKTVTIRPDLVPLSQMETLELIPRAQASSGFAKTDIKVTVKDVDGPFLEGALVRISSGAWTPAVRNTPHESHTGADGSATIAAELMSSDSVERFSVTVSKPGYKEFSRVVEINNKWGKAVGTTTEIDPVWLDKAPVGIGTIEVKVTVLDSQTNNGVPDTEVILDGPEYKTATTDNSGVATLSVKEGSYVVKLSQDNYWPAKDKEIKLPGDAPEPFRLVRKPTKDAAGDTIEVIVLALEHAGTKDKPRPLKNAWVSDGRQTTMTDAEGKATLRGAYAIDHSVTVTADNYEPSTQRVRINSSMFSTATGRATFLLKPALNDNTPIRLIVEVVDELGKPVPGAGVEFFHQGRSLYMKDTDEKGERDFRSSDTSVPVAELRKGITLDVSLGRKKVVENRQVPADLLKPSIVARRFQVTLDWSELRKAIEALEPRVFAWNKDIKADSTAATQSFKDTAATAVERAKKLEVEITAPFLAINLVSGVSLCSQAAPYLLNIPANELQARQKAQALEQKINQATALTKTCSTLNDPELIRSGYREAIKLLAEIASLEKKVVADSNALRAVAKKNAEALGVAREMKRKLPELATLHTLAEENLKTAVMKAQTQSEVSKTLIKRQLTLKAEHSVLSVKAFSEIGVPDDLLERITVMDGILRSKSKGSQDPELVPRSVEQAPEEIKAIQDKVTRMIAALENAACPVATLDDVVKGMGTAVFNSGIEVGLASDLPKLADACAAKAASRTTAPPIKPAATSAKSDPPITVQNNPTTDDKQPVFNPPVDDKTVADPPTGDKTTNSPNPTNTTNTTKTSQTTAPAQSNNQPTSSGGFWDTAKKSGKNVKDTITNKPTTGGNSTAANRDPNAGNKPNNKPANPPLTVEDIPEDTTTTVAVNKPPSKSGGKTPVVEDIPEDSTPTIASNKPRAGSGSAPLTVEDIPEDIASNKPGSGSGSAPVVEDIPENDPATNTGSNRGSGNSSGNRSGKEKLPPGLTRDKSGRLQPKNGWEWVNPNDPNDTRVHKKPRDPNKPDFWTQLGGAINQAITGQPNPGVTNNPGSGGGGGGGSAGGLNLAGTWNVTTHSTGDEEMQQNWTRTNVWHIWNLGGGGWRVRQVINGQTYDENYSTVDDGGGRFRLIGRNPDGSTNEMSGTYNQSQFSVSTSAGQHRVVITGTRQ